MVMIKVLLAASEGRWTVRMGGVEVTGGTYGVSRGGDSVAIALDVTEPWRPPVCLLA
jgi:hypothetical protein